jgi:uncharacterized protein
MGSETYHEPVELLSEPTRNMHRAIVSLIEELEAMDWYLQRAEACSDAELKAVLLHHREEEIEHALMNLEWIRRHDPNVDRFARIYLFSEASITAVEAETTRAEAKAVGEPPHSNGTLGIGSLRSE